MTIKLSKQKMERHLKKTISPDIEVLDIRIAGDDPSKLLRINNSILLECADKNGKQQYIIRYPKENISEFYKAECIRDYLWNAISGAGDKEAPEIISLGFFNDKNQVKSLSDFKNVFVIEEFIEGECYADILLNKSMNKECDADDLFFADNIVNYLACREKYCDNGNEIFVLHDCLFLIEKFFIVINRLFWSGQITEDDKLHLEKRIIEWCQKIQKMNRDIVKSHNDFHPWNIIFTKHKELKVIDKGFPGYSDPARDLGTLFPNYLYFALHKRNTFSGMCKFLLDYVLKRYIEKSRDDKVTEAIQPYFAMCCFILSNNKWYPDLNDDNRQYIREMGFHLLNSEIFDLSI
jgi:hypothetical protein